MCDSIKFSADTEKFSQSPTIVYYVVFYVFFFLVWRNKVGTLFQYRTRVSCHKSYHSFISSCTVWRGKGCERARDRGIEKCGIEHTQCGHMTEHWHFSCSYGIIRSEQLNNNNNKNTKPIHRLDKIYLNVTNSIQMNCIVCIRYITVQKFPNQWSVCFSCRFLYSDRMISIVYCIVLIHSEIIKIVKQGARCRIYNNIWTWLWVHSS